MWRPQLHTGNKGRAVYRPSQFDINGGDYEECRLVGYYTVWLL
jgi:hypothetical protein